MVVCKKEVLYWVQVVFGICIFDVEFGAHRGRHKSSFSFWHLYLVLYMEPIVGWHKRGVVFGICIWCCISSTLWVAHERRSVVVGACYAHHQVTGQSGGVQRGSKRWRGRGGGMVVSRIRNIWDHILQQWFFLPIFECTYTKLENQNLDNLIRVCPKNPNNHSSILYSI